MSPIVHVSRRRCTPLVLCMRDAERQAQAAYPIETGAPRRDRLRAEWPMVGGLDAGLPWRVQPGSHAASGLCKPALGDPRPRRRLPTPGAQAGAPSAPRGLKKRKDLIREMLDSGAELLREGGSHTIFRSRTGTLVPVPRRFGLASGR